MSDRGTWAQAAPAETETESGTTGFAEALVASTFDAMVAADGRGRIVMWNAAAERMFGYAPAQALGRSLDIIVPEAMRGEHAAGMRRLTGGGAPRLIGKPVEVPAQHADGHTFQIEMRLSMWGEGRRRMFAAVIRDVSERRRAEDRLHNLALFDQLTMLPNRNLFLDRLGAALGGPDGRPTGVLLVDLDQFAELNDSAGHAAADELLRETALRLRRIVVDGYAGSAADTPTIARLGANDFGVILPGEGDPVVLARVAHAIRAALAERVLFEDHVITATASIGVALAPQHGANAGKLIANADFALRRAKADGGDRRQFFLPAHRQAAVARRALEADLRRAWANREFEVFYQPQVRLSDRRVMGAEALLRWRHPERGLQQPAQFLAALQSSALAGDVGDWVLFEACRQTAQWRAATGRELRIGVNLFETQFVRRDLSRMLRDTLAATGLAADALEIEITENVFTAEDDATVARVRRLRDLGVRIAFDDYGTGYASLSLLKRYPITRLKIDRSFMRDLSDDADDEAIVELVLTLGERFGLEVIAEGVETEAQEAHLRRLGCAEGQGYLYGRPMTARGFEAALDRGEARSGALVA